MNTLFKRSNMTEMCKQIKSAPVIFKKKDGTNCLAFYNNEVMTDATKLYILFPDNTFPKYIEGNDISTLSECIHHNVSSEVATSLYNQINKSHKPETRNFILNLISKSPYTDTIVESRVNLSTEKDTLSHIIYNKKHACVLAYYNNRLDYYVVKDLYNNKVSEIIIDNKVYYDVELTKVLWAVGMSSKEFTALKKLIRDIHA